MTIHFYFVFLAILLLVSSSPAQSRCFTQTNGPYGGFVRCVAIDSSGSILAATDGGLFFSKDNGATWQVYSSTFFSAFGFSALAINNRGHVFASTFDSGIFRSTDNGSSWQLIDIGLPKNTLAYSIIFDSKDQMFISSRDLFGSMVYRSSNNGDSWIPVGLSNVNANYLTASATGTLYAAGPAGKVFRSYNSGSSWDTLSTRYNFEYANDISITNSGDILLSTDVGLLFSNNDGNSWQTLFQGYVYCSAIDSLDRVVIATAGSLNGHFSSSVYRSIDKGLSWTASNSIWPGVLLTSIVFCQKTQTLFLTGESGIYRSSDAGANWEQTNHGLKGTNVPVLWTHHDGNIFAATSFNGVFRSTNSGLGWTRLTEEANSNNILSMALSSKGDIFLGRHDRQGILRSTDMGQTWKQIAFNGFEVFALAIDKQDHVFAAVWGTGIYRSIDNGESWTKTTPDLLADKLVISSKGTIFTYSSSTGFIRSTDNGTTWQQLQSFPQNYRVDHIASGNTGEVIASTYDGLFRTLDDGATWEKMQSPNPHADLFSEKFSLNALGHIYMSYLEGSTSYLKYSTNAGISWFQPDSTFRFLVRSLTFDSAGHLIIGTQSNSVFRSNKSTTSFPKISLRMNRLTFRPVPLGQSHLDSVLIKNTGNDTLVISSIQSASTQFFVYPFLPSTLPNGSFFLTMAFRPTSLGAHSSAIVITSNSDPLGFVSDTIYVSGTADAPSIIDSGAVIPKEFSLSQNYPNPFNSTTTFVFSLPCSAFVTLKIFSLLGSEMAIVVSQELPAGTFTAHWDASGFSSGLYFCRLQAANSVQTRKLLLIR